MSVLFCVLVCGVIKKTFEIILIEIQIHQQWQWCDKGSRSPRLSFFSVELINCERLRE